MIAHFNCLRNDSGHSLSLQFSGGVFFSSIFSVATEIETTRLFLYKFDGDIFFVFYKYMPQLLF